ncbi:MAG: hypothetical protein HC785_30105 [Calothrix sp. CSU_2_0]|nr:hypothetical protein [Calothrix sp. CSU_2_0]
MRSIIGRGLLESAKLARRKSFAGECDRVLVVMVWECDMPLALSSAYRVGFCDGIAICPWH